MFGRLTGIGSSSQTPASPDGRVNQPTTPPPTREEPEFTQTPESPLRQRVRESNQQNAHRSSRKGKQNGSSPLGPQTPSRILWASKASWFSSVIKDDGTMVHRNLVELSDDDTLVAGAKVVYFVYNDINPAIIETLLRPLTPLPTDGLLFSKICDEYARRRSKWSGAIMKYIEHLVVRLVHEWYEVEENQGQEFSELDKKDRQAVWVAEWKRDPAGTAREMWQPVASVIDWIAIFAPSPPGRRDRDQTKLDAVYDMLGVKFLFACDQAFQYRLNNGVLTGFDQDLDVEDGLSAKQELKNWRGFAKHPEFTDIVVKFDQVPVTREKAGGQQG